MPILEDVCRSAVLFSSDPSADDLYQSLISSFFSVHIFGLKIGNGDFCINCTVDFGSVGMLYYFRVNWVDFNISYIYFSLEWNKKVSANCCNS